MLTFYYNTIKELRRQDFITGSLLVEGRFPLNKGGSGVVTKSDISRPYDLCY